MKDESELKEMSKKEKFIECIDSLFADLDMADIDPDVIAYWEAFKGKGTSDKPLFTDNGKMILKYIRNCHCTDFHSKSTCHIRFTTICCFKCFTMISLFPLRN